MLKYGFYLQQIHFAQFILSFYVSAHNVRLLRKTAYVAGNTRNARIWMLFLQEPVYWPEKAWLVRNPAHRGSLSGRTLLLPRVSRWGHSLPYLWQPGAHCYPEHWELADTCKPAPRWTPGDIPWLSPQVRAHRLRVHRHHCQRDNHNHERCPVRQGYISA